MYLSSNQWPSAAGMCCQCSAAQMLKQLEEKEKEQVKNRWKKDEKQQQTHSHKNTHTHRHTHTGTHRNQPISYTNETGECIGRIWAEKHNILDFEQFLMTAARLRGTDTGWSCWIWASSNLAYSNDQRTLTANLHTRHIRSPLPTAIRWHGWVDMISLHTCEVRPASGHVSLVVKTSGPREVTEFN